VRGVVAPLWAVILSAALAASATAQNLTAGSLTGVVQDEFGQSLAKANVTITDLATGATTSTQTDRDGRYTFSLLPPSRYDAFVEQLGYRPKLVQGVLVLATTTVDLTVALAEVRPPVITVDTVPYRGNPQPSRYVVGGPPIVLDLADLVDDRRLLTNVAGLSSAASPALEEEGFPGRLSGLVVDGVPRTAAQHPALAATGADGMAFPLAAFGQAERRAGAADVEWPGFNGGSVSAQSLRGALGHQPKAYGDWSAEGPRGGVLVSGPMMGDSASFVAGAEAAQLSRTLPAPWTADSLAAGIVAQAQGFSGTDLGSYLQDYDSKTSLFDGFARFEWQIAPTYAVAVRGSFAAATVKNPGLGSALAPSLGSTLQTRDVSAEAWLTSRLSTKAALELRFGMDGSTRDYQAPALPATTIVDGGLAAGSDDALPGRFRRTDVRISGTLHFRAGPHRFKLGLGLAFATHNQTYAAGTSGQYVFAGDSEFALRRGLFTQTVGPLPTASFSMPQTSFYVQDLWTPVHGLEILLGLRSDAEQWPRSDIVLNQAWLASTNISNTNIPKSAGQLSPRLSLRWTGGGTRPWIIHGDAGLYFSGADPAVMAELLTRTGALEVRRGLGDLGAWPAVPDSTVAPVTGQTLTLLSSGFTPPRTGRVTLGISRSLTTDISVDVSGTYRHTDYLPRRSDLNLRLAPGTTDQYGRTIYGTLEQEGSLIAAAPGSNRRFGGFDLVSAINPDGFSDYWGVTIALERTITRGLNLLASYTYSRTTDNWLGAGGGGPDAQLSPFPDSLNGIDWAKGRSDLDVPHRLLVGAEITLPTRMGVRLGLLYQYRSGYPFTPGFRAGVDANGDGSGSNDPAFVDNTVPGMNALVAQWDCLRPQIGRFAQRNSCRAPGVQNLSARLAVGLLRVGDHRAELVVDALNVVHSDVGIVDRALYLVDRAGAISTSPQGVVTIPLVANPNFGKLLVRQTGATVWRVGLRMNY
jgi:hypothetical protein